LYVLFFVFVDRSDTTGSLYLQLPRKVSLLITTEQQKPLYKDESYGEE
jgi:hypothetical protein